MFTIWRNQHIARDILKTLQLLNILRGTFLEIGADFGINFFTIFGAYTYRPRGGPPNAIQKLVHESRCGLEESVTKDVQKLPHFEDISSEVPIIATSSTSSVNDSPKLIKNFWANF